MSIFDIKSAADLRNYVYVILPVVAALFVTLGVFDDAHAAMWVALITAVVGPGLAFVMTRNVSTFRTAFYAIVTAIQAIVIGYGIATDDQLSIWLPLVVTIVGAAGGSVSTRYLQTTAPAS